MNTYEHDNFEQLIDQFIDLCDDLGHCECEVCILKDKKRCKGIDDFKGDAGCMKRYMHYYINIIEQDKRDLETREAYISR